MIIVVLLVVAVLIVISYPSFIQEGTNLITGKQVQQGLQIPSQASVAKRIALVESATLGGGIVWTGLNPGDVNINANGNDDGLGNTQYNILVHPSTNVPVDFCIGADGNLVGVGDPLQNIPLNPNYQWDSDVTAIGPILANAQVMPIPTDPAPNLESGREITRTNRIYFRFWLSVPTGQAADTYQNNIDFLGIEGDGNSLTAPVCP